MKISVVMIDGGFRENVYGAKYFSQQTLPDDEYEVIWVEYYDKPHPQLEKYPKVNVVCLGEEGEYHSSHCFNKGIELARGEVVVIPDADQIVDDKFLEEVWKCHDENEELVMYIYRYDEIQRGQLASFDISELESKCILKNSTNYGGCLTVRKKWLTSINGYEMHDIFSSGFHANGLDVYTRFKNYGLPVKWHPTLKLYHPWHEHTLSSSTAYDSQKRLIEWRSRNLNYLAFYGLSQDKNIDIPGEVNLIHEGMHASNKDTSFARKLGRKILGPLKRLVC